MNNNRQQPDFSTQQFDTSAYDDRMPRDLLYRARRNTDDLINLIQTQFQYHSRILVVRIDLKYRPEVSPHVHIDGVQMHRERFLENRSSHPDAFEGLLAYAWGLEYGEHGSGYHYHFLMLYDGSERRNDTHIGMAIDALWHTITNGYGQTYICNFDKEKLENQGVLGIGMINRDDYMLRGNLIEKVAPYITKKCRDFDARSGRTVSGDLRTYGRSNMPQEFNVNAPRRGRPRVG